MNNRGSFARLKNGASFSIGCATEDGVLMTVSQGIDFENTAIHIDREGIVLLADALYKSVGLEPIERLYYLKLIDGSDEEMQYINYRKEEEEVFIGDDANTVYMQTKFTLQEINSNPKLKKYAQFKVPVK